MQYFVLLFHFFYSSRFVITWPKYRYCQQKKQQFSMTEMTTQQNEGYDVTIDDYEVIN